MAAGLRLPLYPAEATAPPTTVVVTGASGFLAGPLVARLLAAGMRSETLTESGLALLCRRAKVQCYMPLMALQRSRLLVHRSH